MRVSERLREVVDDENKKKTFHKGEAAAAAYSSIFLITSRNLFLRSKLISPVRESGGFLIFHVHCIVAAAAFHSSNPFDDERSLFGNDQISTRKLLYGSACSLKVH
jgi:hypothetical protein